MFVVITEQVAALTKPGERVPVLPAVPVLPTFPLIGSGIVFVAAASLFDVCDQLAAGCVTLG